MIRAAFNVKHLEDIQARRHVSSDRFRLENADDTIHLGRAFAHAVRGMRGLSQEWQRPVRIGIRARSGTGKTTFVRGIMAELGGYKIIEDIPGPHWQALRQHKNPENGFLRNYDPSLEGPDGSAYEPLPSYIANNHNEYGLPFVDIVEHPTDDVYNTAFDCMVFMDAGRWLDRKAARAADILPAHAVRNTAGYNTFLEQARVFSVRPDPLPARQP